MAKSVTITTLTIGTRGSAVAYKPGTPPASVIIAGNYGATKSATVATLTIERRPIVSVTFYDLLTTIITGSNCPPAPKPPLTGQRFPGYTIL